LPVVDLLEGFALHGVAGDLADEQDHRRRVLLGDVDPGAGVGGAGSPGGEADAGPPGELAIGLRHHGGPAFLAAYQEAQVGRIEKRIEHRQIAFARHAEGQVGAVNPQLVHQNPPATPHITVLRHCSNPHQLLPLS
jgi:hypothetical protein